MKPELNSLPGRQRSGGPVILCVDDEPGILRALERCFRNEPYIVLTAPGPEEALRRFLQIPHVDLVLADERMPRMAGTDFLREIRRTSPGTALAVLTGFPSDILIQKGLEVGASLFLYKPWDDETLRDTISRVLLLVKRDVSDDAPSTFDIGGEGG